MIALESTSLLSSSNTGRWTSKILSWFSVHLNGVQLYYTNALMRKIGHFTGYALLSWFFFRGWLETFHWQAEEFLQRSSRPVRLPRRWLLRAAVIALLCTIAVAGLDEFHQSFLMRRTGVLRDVVLDSMGGVFAQLVLLLYWTRNERRPPRAASYARLEDLTAD